MKTKPNVIVPFDDKERFKNLVLEVINDTSIYTLVPDSISLDGVLFTLILQNKKFVFEDMKVDVTSDYIDVYLQGVKKSASSYTVTDDGTNIIINFIENITLRPQDITEANEFLVKGKIVSR